MLLSLTRDPRPAIDPLIDAIGVMMPNIRKLTIRLGKMPYIYERDEEDDVVKGGLSGEEMVKWIVFQGPCLNR